MDNGHQSSIAEHLTEADLQASVEDLLTFRGWLWHHETDSRKSHAGFLDLVALRDHRIVAIELKAAKGKTTPGQERWLDAWILTPAEAYLWRPADWFDGSIDRVLA